MTAASGPLLFHITNLMKSSYSGFVKTHAVCFVSSAREEKALTWAAIDGLSPLQAWRIRKT